MFLHYKLLDLMDMFMWVKILVRDRRCQTD
ncbi:hypothetical protein YPPY103_0484, partial [Yersinia pestis PY-103]